MYQSDNTFFISDIHFNHGKIIPYCKRPFVNVDEMNQAMVDNWNSVVKDGDHVFFLGDLYWKNPNLAVKLLNKLKGNIYCVKGNHDSFNVKVQERFSWVKDYYEVKIKDGETKQRIVLCHFPIASWHKKDKGAWHLHGHSHGKVDPLLVEFRKNNFIMDVGVDCIGYKPISYGGVVDHFQKKVDELLLNI